MRQGKAKEPILSDMSEDDRSGMCSWKEPKELDDMDLYLSELHQRQHRDVGKAR